MSIVRVGRATAKAMIEAYKDVVSQNAMSTNGTAIEGVCVTGAALRLNVLVASKELSRWQTGMAQYLPSRCAWAIVLSRYKEMVDR